METAENPDKPRTIIDRRNELSGNLSLLQEIRTIRSMNGAVKGERFYKPVAFGFIDMSEELTEMLDYPTKLDRRIEQVSRLHADGQRQAEDFLGRWMDRKTRHWRDDDKAKKALHSLPPPPPPT
jgi:NTE family protein